MRRSPDSGTFGQPTGGEVDAEPGRALGRLGRLSVREFMRRHWQRRPALIRAALPGVQPPLSAAQLFALAARGDVESRLVSTFGGRWQLRHGPFARRTLPARKRAGWTLLVQGVDRHDPAAAALLARFRFLPDARLDDLMISYASDGGGVGPHVDSYDVFLLQVRGRRCWRISRQRNLESVAGMPLKLLAEFRATQQWVLEPGDLLYLPPGVAHEGTAVGGDCMTCSIGFRAPRYRDVLERWFDAALETPALQRQCRDAGLATRAPARLPAAMVEDVFERMRRLRPGRAHAVRALLGLLSEPKPIVTFEARGRAPTASAFAAAIARRGLRADRRSRLLYTGGAGGEFAINGETFALPAAASALRSLADRRRLAPASCAGLSAHLCALLLDWYVAGWIHVGADEADPP
jgi:50S ribosomal protein L16 3-hydroxylase